MRVTATLRCVKTGEVRTSDSDMEVANLIWCRSWWTEGNFGCDCNRRLAFVRGHADYCALTHETLLAEQVRAEGLPVQFDKEFGGSGWVDDGVLSPCGTGTFELVSLVTEDGQDLLKEEKS